MKRRALGTQGLTVSCIGLGCMGMSEFYGAADEAESLRTLDRALELGCDFLDTADVYGPFKNEELLGRFLEGRRDRVVIATKFGIVRSPDDPTKRGICGRPDYVKQACDASLARLGIETIDLYYQHRVDDAVPIEETVGAMKELVEAGKVRYLGLSEAAPATLRRAHAVHPISALQSEYSLWNREPEDNGVLATVRDLGVGFVPYSPLGRGFLTGEIRRFEDLEPGDYRRTSPRFQGENFDRNLQLVARIQQMARARACTPAQLALAWILVQGEMVVPIPGTKKVSRLEENLGALRVVLTAEDLRRIEEIAPRGAASGDRYSPEMMRFVHR